MNTDTLERIIPDLVNRDESTGSETLDLHLERYHFAYHHLKPGKILDIACGVGYGSYFIAADADKKIDSITSVDISKDAIDYANSRYSHPKISFVCADATTFLPEEKFDTIISLETIEHLPDPHKFIAHLKTLLKNDGILIGSVPVTPSVDANPHHLSDFTERSFRKMFTKLGFEEIIAFPQVQSYSPFNIVTRKEKRMKQMRHNLLQYYITHPQSLGKRIFSIFTDGFNNRYLTIAWKLKSL